MRRLLLLLALLAPSVAWAQTDPLNSAYLPAIDTTCTDYASNVWATNSLYVVYQNTGTKDCTKWQQTYYGTQNEFVDFQVHFHDTGSGTTGFQVTTSSFVKSTGPGGNFTIAAEDATHTDILIYKEAYINVSTTTLINKADTPTYLNITQAAPGTATTGFLPDPLIPTIDPYFHQVTNGFPQTVAANQNQSAWIDIHVPPAAPSGYYLGTVTVSRGCAGTYPGTGCTTVASIPIIIAVWQWPSAGFMPSKATLQGEHAFQDTICAGFAGGTGFDTACGNAVPAASGSATTAANLIQQWGTVLYLDHRLQEFESLQGLSGIATYYTGSFNGTTNTCTGCANTILPGAKLNVSQWDANGGTQQQWMTQFQTNGWPLPYWYRGHDEPTSQAVWTTIHNDAVTGHALTPPMPILSTTSFKSISEFSRIPTTVGQNAVCGTNTCLTNSVDVLVSNVIDMVNGENANLATYNSFLAGTSNIGTGPPRKWYSYEACDPACGGAFSTTPAGFNIELPNYTLDMTTISHRVISWFDMFAGQTGDLYFSEAICWKASGVSGCGTFDPWASVNYNGTNGDGTMVYPGRTTTNTSGFTTGNLGISTPILVPSMRLKHLRDGSQDFEYMTILKANGQSSLVASTINSVIYTGNASGTLQPWSFNNTQAPAGPFTSDLPDARATLGTTMHQLTFPSSGGCGSPLWISLLACSRGVDWSKAGANNGSTPNYTVQSGSTIAAYGLDNRGAVTSNAAVMSVTSVTKGTNVATAWAATGTFPTNKVALEIPISFGSLAVGTPSTYTVTSFPHDTFNTGSDWVGKTFTITHSGTPYNGTIQSVGTDTIVFTTTPLSVGGAVAPAGTGYSSGGAVSATISSVDTVGHTFTLSGTPTIAVSGYIYAGSGDPTPIVTDLLPANCTGGKFVLLGAGHFNLINGIGMATVNGCVLRGSGADQTTISSVFAAGSNCGGNPSMVCIGDATASVAPGAFPVNGAAVLPGGTNDATWTGTTEGGAGVYPVGATHLTLTNVGSASIHNGQTLILDQDDTFLNVASGYEFCIRNNPTSGGSGGHPPSMCNQEPPFGGRNGRIRGTISTTNGSTAVTWVSGSQFVTDGTWTNAGIVVNGAQKIIASVASATSLTLVTAATSTASVPYFVGYRGQTQSVQVTAGCTSACTGAGPFTVTITPGLYGINWAASQNPAAWFPTGFATFNAGVEDMTLDKIDDVSINSTTVGFENVHDSWAKGIRTLHGDRSHFWVGYSNHITIQNNYCYGTQAGGTQSYCLEQNSSSDVLFMNNICQQIVGCMVPVGNSGSVFAYNFGIDNYVGDVVDPVTVTAVQISGGNATYTYVAGLFHTNCSPTSSIACRVNFLPVSVAGIAGTVSGFNLAGMNLTNVLFPTATGTTFTVPVTSLPCNATSTCPATLALTTLATPATLHLSNSVMSGNFIPHGDGNRYLLIEGNIGDQFHPDTIHGAARALTVNRNYFGGNEKGLSQQLVPIRIEPLERYNNFFANVLGSTSTLGYNNYPGCSSGCTGSNWAYSWQTSASTEATNIIDADPFSQSTSYRWGNIDIINNPTTARFDSTEVPTTDTFGYAQTVPTCSTTAACFGAVPSFFLSGTPAFFNTQFGTVPYPPIGPDVVGGTAMAPDMTGTTTPPGGHAFDNAASKVWQNAPIDPAYVGFDGGVRLFNEVMYTPASSGAAAILLPNPLAFGNQNVNTTSPVSFVVFSNTGTANVTVSGITVSGHFSQSGGSCTVPITIAPRNNCNIGITFSPNATGPFTGTVSVTSNAVPSPTVANLTGTGTQATITWVSPQGGTAYNFGNIPVSSSINSANLTLTNSGTGPLTVTPTIGGANPAQFSIISNTCPGSLGAGLSCTFVVRFTATAATTYTALLTETDSNASNSPQSMTLSGSGFIPVVNPVVPWPPIILSP